MKHSSLMLLLAAALGSSSAMADVFPESFESGSLEEIGWTASATGLAGCEWKVCTYASQTTQFPNNLQAPEGWGEMTLHGLTKGAGFAASAEAPDILAASPEFEVADKTWFSFMMANNMVNNGGANVADEAKTIFEVVVSPDGDADKEAFTDVLYSETPKNLNNWKVINVDLSAYKGKKVRVGFRMHSEEPAMKNAMSNFLYIDAVQLLEEPAADVALENVSGIFSGCDPLQYPTVTILNHGKELSQIEILATVNDGEPVSEIATIDISHGETVEYTFTNPITLQEGENRVKLELNLDGDINAGNNVKTLSSSILSTSELPFTMSDGEEASLQLVTTGHGSTKVPDGWQYFLTSRKWIHTAYKKIAYLHTAEAYELDETPLKVSFETELTGESATMAVYLTKNLSDFGEPVATCPLTPLNPNGFVIVPVENPGNYIIALRVLDSPYPDQVVLNAYSIKKAGTLPDVGISAINLDRGILVGEEMPVEITLFNEGSEDALNITASYSYGDVTVEENAGNLAAGESKNFVFSVPFVSEEVGRYELTARVTVNGDINDDNGTASMTLSAYEPYATPYKESFENDSDMELWRLFNTNSSTTNWNPLDGYEFDGTHILALPADTKEHQAFAVSPVISIPAGWSGRLSYYYGAGGNEGSSVLRTYLTKAETPEEILAETPVDEHSTSGTNVSYASTPINVEEAGNYRIVFYASEGMESLLIDDLRLDSTRELAATGAELSITDVAYDLEPGTVTISGVNYSDEEMSGVKLAYTVYLTTFTESTPYAYFEEDYNQVIPAGAEFSHSFSKKVDFVEEGIYNVAVALSSADDTDLKNNTFMGDGPEKLTTMQFPAKWDMELSYHLHGYNLGTWKIGAVDVYSGNRSLTHTGRARAEGGDLVTFNRVYLPAGSYDFSFFWKTATNQTSGAYCQTFRVLLGDGPERSDLTETLLTFNYALSEDKCHSKALVPFTIEKAGYYWIGINLTESGEYGSLTIDDFMITTRQADYTLTNLDDTYDATFPADSDEWQFYHPNGLIAQQWLVNEEEGCLELFELSDPVAGDYVGSWLQAPSFMLARDMIYDLSVDLEILPIYSESPLSGQECVKLYASDIDLPTEFVEIGSFNAGNNKIRYQSETDGLRYFTLRSNSNHQNAAFRLKGFTIKAAEVSGLESVEGEGWKLEGDILSVADGSVATVYTLSGIKVAEETGTIRLPKGIYMISVDGHTQKVMIR